MVKNWGENLEIDIWQAIEKKIKKVERRWKEKDA